MKKKNEKKKWIEDILFEVINEQTLDSQNTSQHIFHLN